MQLARKRDAMIPSNPEELLNRPQQIDSRSAERVSLVRLRRVPLSVSHMYSFRTVAAFVG